MIFSKRNGRDEPDKPKPLPGIDGDGPWWMYWTGMVPRETYLRVVRLYRHADDDRRLAEAEVLRRERGLAGLRLEIRGLRAEFGVLKSEADAVVSSLKAEVRDLQRMLHAERSEIRGALSRVSVYEGIVEHAPLAQMVAELGRDHEELEARIESVLDVILTRANIDGLDKESEEYDTLNKISGLLQGKIERVPDTPEELIEGGDDRG